MLNLLNSINLLTIIIIAFCQIKVNNSQQKFNEEQLKFNDITIKKVHEIFEFINKSK